MLEKRDFLLLFFHNPFKVSNRFQPVGLVLKGYPLKVLKVFMQGYPFGLVFA